MEPIVNRVANSGLITINLENFLPEAPLALFDIKEYLFHGLILKEKDFRTALKELDWSLYKDQHIAICCTADAIIPIWAYMLIASYLEPVAKNYIFGDKQALELVLIKERLAKLDTSEYEDKRVVIKGCGEKPIPEAAYVEITRLLKPVVKSLMYGEPCSVVPVYKKRIVR